MNTKQKKWMDQNKIYYGDIHNHSCISYGHGVLKDALINAETQLDFASVTGHYSWPDIDGQTMPDEVIQYHIDGFKKFRSNIKEYIDTLKSFYKENSFVPFLSFEIHSFAYGDYTVIVKDFVDSWPDPKNNEELDKLLRNTSPESGYIFIPHHIGYKTGFRGINWNAFQEAASPLVEIISMHGCAERSEMPFRYLHTMGPRDSGNTMQGGLAMGQHFGVTGSTDHHNSFPGSYGHGRTAVWSSSLDRESIWDSFVNRRTYALTGDRIDLAFFVNDSPMGSIINARREMPRKISAFVKGGYELESVEVIKNNEVFFSKKIIKSHNKSYSKKLENSFITGKFPILFGWGEKGVAVEWQCKLKVLNGVLLFTESRFRGQDLVDPLEGGGSETYNTCPCLQWDKDSNLVSATFMTNGNLSPSTDCTQQICLEISGNRNTVIEADVSIKLKGENINKTFIFSLENRDEPQSFYMNGFISPVILTGPFITEDLYTFELDLEDNCSSGKKEDWYYIRVMQKNGQGAWSSPVWVNTV